MNAQTPEPRTKGEKLNEGKTKKIFADLSDPLDVIVESKNDITAGDGKMHDVILNKGVLATSTTCNVFRLLKDAGLPVAFNKQVDKRSFSAKRGNMLKLEVVIRREAHGSYCVRNPHVPKGTIFPKLIFELFLKTSGKQWHGQSLDCDDPYVVWIPHRNIFELYDVKKVFTGQRPFGTIPVVEVFKTGDIRELLTKIEEIARRAFLVLEKQWQLLGRRLIDFKIELDDQLRISDVVDNDSWRLLKDGRYEDKQVYREGGSLSEVAANYARVADLTDRFGLPRQKIVVWRGSESDSVAAFGEILAHFLGSLATHVPDPAHPNLTESPLRFVTCSMHKEAEQGLKLLRQLEQECPDSVIIACIGRSNGAGPTLSAHTTLPVINCSPSIKDFHEDVWSSLRAPSDVPCLTVLDPANAALAALNILSARNPALYAALRYRMEERFINTIVI